MAVKYHINPKTGRPNICRAKTPESCLYYDKESNTPVPHYDSKEEARAGFERSMDGNKSVSLSKKIKGNSFTMEIPKSRLDEIVRKIESKNGKIKRVGGERLFEVKVLESFVERDVNYAGFPVYTEKLRIEINEPLIKVGNYSFAGVVNKEEGGLIYKNLTNDTDFYKPESIECDHCGKKRHRTQSYIIKDEVTGEFKQIGSACVEPFLGAEAPVLNFNEEELIDKDEWYHKKSSQVLPTKDVLKLALAITDQGRLYHSKSNAEIYGGESTIDTVKNWIYLDHGDSELINRVGKNYKKIEEENSVEYMMEELSKDDSNSEWLNNIKTILKGDKVSDKNLGLLVSSVVYFRKLSERKNEVSFSKGFVGNVGDKIGKQKVKVVKKITREVFDPYSYKSNTKLKDILVLQDQDGRMLTFFASRQIRVDEGSEVVLNSATIKEHKVYKGNDQTVIMRARFVENKN